MKNSFFCIKKRLFYFFFLFFFPLQALASLDDYLPQGPGVSSSNYGDVGLIVFPSARFEEEGVLKMGYSSSYPYEFTSISATPFPWLEAVFRYTEIKNE